MSTGMTGTAGTSTFKPALWTPGDWNALFGFGTNILVNMLVLTGLLQFRAEDAGLHSCSAASCAALGLMMCLSTFYTPGSLTGWRRDRPQRRLRAVGRQRATHVHRHLRDHAADHDQDRRSHQGLVGEADLGVLQSFILMIGGFIAPYIRKITRARRCSARSPVFPHLHLDAAGAECMRLEIGLVCFAIILVSWFGGVKIWRGHAGRPRRHCRRHDHRSGSNLFGLGRRPEPERRRRCLRILGFSVALPAIGHVFSGFEFLGIILVTQFRSASRSRRSHGQCRKRGSGW
jgi:AGZA family xanthine/uracil permease-like MFS transporter